MAGATADSDDGETALSLALAAEITDALATYGLVDAREESSM